MMKSKYISGPLKITAENIPDEGALIRCKEGPAWKDAVFLSIESVERLGPVLRLATVETGSNFFASLDRVRNPRPVDLRCHKAWRF